MTNLYPSNYEIFKLTQVAGGYHITTQACEKINKYTRELINKIVYRMVILSLETNNFNYENNDYEYLIDYNIDYDNYIIQEYHNENNIPNNSTIKQYQENSNYLITSRSCFLGALRNSLSKLSSEYKNFKISLQVSSVLQKYIENKIIELIRDKLTNIYGNILFSGYFYSEQKNYRKVTNYNIDFYDTICDVIKNNMIDYEISNKNLKKINHIVNLFISNIKDEYHSILNINKNLNKENKNVLNIAIKYVWDFYDVIDKNIIITNDDEVDFKSLFKVMGINLNIIDQNIIFKLINNFIHYVIKYNLNNNEQYNNLMKRIGYTNISTPIDIKIMFPLSVNNEEYYIPTLFEEYNPEISIDGFSDDYENGEFLINLEQHGNISFTFIDSESASEFCSESSNFVLYSNNFVRLIDTETNKIEDVYDDIIKPSSIIEFKDHRGKIIINKNNKDFDQYSITPDDDKINKIKSDMIYPQVLPKYPTIRVTNNIKSNYSKRLIKIVNSISETNSIIDTNSITLPKLAKIKHDTLVKPFKTPSPEYTKTQQFKPPSVEFQPSQQQFKPPSVEFQPPSVQQFKQPSVQQFQPPSVQQFQPPSVQQFKQPSIQQFQPPSIQQFQPPSIQQFQPPSIQQFKQPSIQQFQPSQQQFQQPSVQQQFKQPSVAFQPSQQQFKPPSLQQFKPSSVAFQPSQQQFIKFNHPSETPFKQQGQFDISKHFETQENKQEQEKFKPQELLFGRQQFKYFSNKL